MSSRLTECVVDCADPTTLSRFWAAALGYQVLDESADLVEIGPGGRTDAERVSDFRSGPAVPSLVFIRVPEPKTVKNRVHWDVKLADASIDDLVDAGATLLRTRDGEIDWWVMADPEGNEFCAFQ